MTRTPTNLAFVLGRLGEMARAPRMWALTKEGFMMQALVLVEVLGIEGRAAMGDVGRTREGRVDLQSNLDDIYAQSVVNAARTLIGKVETCDHGNIAGACNDCEIDANC